MVNLPPLDGLTLEQQFELRQMAIAAESMSKAQALDLLMHAKRLLLIKSNFLASLVNVNLGKDVSVACGERLSKPP